MKDLQDLLEIKTASNKRNNFVLLLLKFQTAWSVVRDLQNLLEATTVNSNSSHICFFCFVLQVRTAWRVVRVIQNLLETTTVNSNKSRIFFFFCFLI